MNPWKLATGAALCAAAFTVTTAAGASSPAPPVTTLDPEVVKALRGEAHLWRTCLAAVREDHHSGAVLSKLADAIEQGGGGR